MYWSDSVAQNGYKSRKAKVYKCANANWSFYIGSGAYTSLWTNYSFFFIGGILLVCALLSGELNK
jgi:hypothetical protein